MSPVVDPVVTPYIEALLACLGTEIAKVANPPDVTCLRAGDRVELLVSTTYDECCAGLAWVRVAQIYPSSEFPDQDNTHAPCGVQQWAVVAEMGVARCAPTPPAERVPTCAEWETITRAVLDDAAAMRRALCCFATELPDTMFVPGTWTPLQVEGGCLGGVMPVTIAVPACDCVVEGS